MKVTQAAELLGMNRVSVNKAIRTGALKAQKFKRKGGVRYEYDITIEEVNRYNNLRKSKKRPLKPKKKDTTDSIKNKKPVDPKKKEYLQEVAKIPVGDPVPDPPETDKPVRIIIDRAAVNRIQALEILDIEKALEKQNKNLKEEGKLIYIEEVRSSIGQVMSIFANELRKIPTHMKSRHGLDDIMANYMEKEIEDCLRSCNENIKKNVNTSSDSARG